MRQEASCAAHVLLVLSHPMEINTSSASVYVGEYWGDLLIVAGSYLKSCLWCVEMMGDITEGHSLEDVGKEFGFDEVREALRRPLHQAWSEGDDDAYESSDEAPMSFMPDNDLICGQESWLESVPLLDDSDWLPEDLPDELLKIAHYPETSPMTGYDPCNWAIAQRELVCAFSEEAGFTVFDGTQQFKKFEAFRQRL